MADVTPGWLRELASKCEKAASIRSRNVAEWLRDAANAMERRESETRISLDGTSRYVRKARKEAALTERERCVALIRKQAEEWEATAKGINLKETASLAEYVARLRQEAYVIRELASLIEATDA